MAPATVLQIPTGPWPCVPTRPSLGTRLPGLIGYALIVLLIGHGLLDWMLPTLCPTAEVRLPPGRRGETGVKDKRVEVARVARQSHRPPPV